MNIGGRFDFDPPHIFVGEALSSMNIIHVCSSVTWPHRCIYGGRVDGIRLATDEYRWPWFHIVLDVSNRHCAHSSPYSHTRPRPSPPPLHCVVAIAFTAAQPLAPLRFFLGKLGIVNLLFR
jgi:hypothetical protein